VRHVVEAAEDALRRITGVTVTTTWSGAADAPPVVRTVQDVSRRAMSFPATVGQSCSSRTPDPEDLTCVP
jgi:hypothetical protein